MSSVLFWNPIFDKFSKNALLIKKWFLDMKNLINKIVLYYRTIAAPRAKPNQSYYLDLY